MSNNLFRQKSLDRISSPEQLNDYIRVSTPSVWIVLLAIIILLTGICVWGVFGQLDTTLPVVAKAQDGVVTAYVQEANIGSVTLDAPVSIADSEYKITAIDPQPIVVDAAFTSYMLHVGSLQEGEWVYAVTLDAPLADGVYAAKIVVESVSPISFVLN